MDAYSEDMLMNEQQRLDVIQHEMTDLFELRRGSEGFFNCPNFAFISPAMKHWVTNPCRLKNGRHIPARAGYDRMVASLGKEDNFSVAVSPREFPNTAWLSCEWDFADVTPDELFLANRVNQDLLAILERHLHLHWKFTGNRSVHLDVFLARPIDKKLGKRFLDSVAHLMGKEFADKTNLTQCMRVPFSRHIKTNGLCRYEGCHTNDDLCCYIKHIDRDEVNEQIIADLCEQMEAHVSAHNPTVVTVLTDNTPPMQEAKTHGIGGVETHSTDEQAPTDEQLQAWRNRVNHSPYLLNHTRRQEYLGYIDHGIPAGEFDKIVFGDNGAFPLFVMAMIGAKDDAHAFMRYLAGIGVDDAARLNNRLGRVDYLFRTFFSAWQDCDGSYFPVDKLQAFDWLPDYVEKMRGRFMERFNHRRLVNNLVQVMQYCLVLLYKHPEGATIAVAAVARRLQICKKTAIGHLRTLREDFPVIKVKVHHDHFRRKAADYVLNEEYVQSVLGYIIRSELAFAA